jgi:hypothetical protein
MGTDLLTIIVFTVPIFISLEFILVIIPALMNRAKVKQKLQSPPDIPDILRRPLTPEDRLLMRSWYVDRSDSRSYIRQPLNIYPPSVPVRTAQKGSPGSDVPMQAAPGATGPGPANDWMAINKANGKIQNANNAIVNANRAISEANAAIERANVADLAWMDSLADIDPIDFV